MAVGVIVAEEDCKHLTLSPSEKMQTLCQVCKAHVLALKNSLRFSVVQ